MPDKAVGSITTCEAGIGWLQQAASAGASYSIMFNREEREEIRAALVRAAQADSNVTGAAHLGSAAADRLDDWSDIDFALCISPNAAMDEVIALWTARLYDGHGAIAHCDVRRGETLYRVFLLRNTLQVDISFWPANRFRATGPKFKLIFGTSNEGQPSPVDSTAELIGLAWLYGLHVRSSIARHRLLQAEYMLSNMRNRVIALACVREGFSTSEGRGFDDLSKNQRSRFAECYPSSLNPDELQCAFQRTMSALLREIRLRDSDLAERIGPTLIEVAGRDASPSWATGNPD
jgi:hypothetical protein